MAIHICITCDKKDCSTAQSAAFDNEREAYGDLLDALRRAGWLIRQTEIICPVCKYNEANSKS